MIPIDLYSEELLHRGCACKLTLLNELYALKNLHILRGWYTILLWEFLTSKIDDPVIHSELSQNCVGSLPDSPNNRCFCGEIKSIPTVHLIQKWRINGRQNNYIREQESDHRKSKRHIFWSENEDGSREQLNLQSCLRFCFGLTQRKPMHRTVIVRR